MDELQPSSRATATGRNTTVRQPTEGIGVTGSDRAVAAANCRLDDINDGPTDPNQETTRADAVRRLGCYRSETKRSPTRLMGGRSNRRGWGIDSDSYSLGRQADFTEFHNHQEFA